MAVSKRRQGYWWSRIHFLLRLLGLTGVMLAAAGAGLAYLNRVLQVETLLPALRGEHGLWEQIAVGLLAGGLAVAVLALLVELFAIVFLTVGRRSLSGVSALVQVVLAVAILASLNVYSFRHYLRLDWTRASDFTLPQHVQDELRNLKGEVTIVVDQHDRSDDQSGRNDPRAKRTALYDKRAREKIVEKVKDLVEQFREFGPQFRVEVLDDENYETRLDQVTQDRPDLRRAIELADDNTIFFYRPAAGGQAAELGQLAFNDFYQLDKKSSQQTKNLVLLPQGDRPPPAAGPGQRKLDHQYTRGVEPFARMILGLGAPRPRVALGVIHPYLGSEGPLAEYRMKAARKALEAHGFDVKDVILMKTAGGSFLDEWDAFTAEEARLDEKETVVEGLKEASKLLEGDRKEVSDLLNEFKKLSLEELGKKYQDQLQGAKMTERVRQAQIDQLQVVLDLSNRRLEAVKKEQDKAVKEVQELGKVESLAEKHHLTDLKLKTARALEDCDLLILPRMTVFGAGTREALPSKLHQLRAAQFEAIKDFVKSGKRLLVCVGPDVQDPSYDRRETELKLEPDQLGTLLGDLGFRLGKDVLLYESQREALLTASKQRSALGGTAVEVPPALFDWPQAAGERPGATTIQGTQPIRASMQLLARGVGKDQPLEVKVNYARSVEYVGNSQQPSVFMRTGEDVAREPYPFALKSGARDRKELGWEHGYFPIGTAVEEQVPRSWYGSEKTEPKTTRVAVIGSGRLFVDEELTPAKERLLTNVCNWLVGRDDQLPKNSGATWAYPRVQMEEREKDLWRWGMQAYLPAVFAFLGLVVVLVRRLR